MDKEMFFTQNEEKSSILKRYRLDLFTYDGFTVGFVKFELPAVSVMYIFNLKVYYKFRRKGYAKLLLKETIKRIKEFDGITKITINALPFADCECPLNDLIKFYASFGFQTFNINTDNTHNMSLELTTTFQ